MIDGKSEPVIDDPGHIFDAALILIAVNRVDLSGRIFCTDISIAGNLQNIDFIGLHIKTNHHNDIGELGPPGALSIVNAGD